MSSSRYALRPVTAVLALGGLVGATAACAGTRVGDVVGAPSVVNSTVQARVVSSTPVVAQVAVPRQVCFDELQQQPARSSGGGALLGAIAGGAVGNAMGKGAGNALATGLGIFGGAILGDHVENDGRQGSVRSVRRCEQQAAYENRVVAYNVVYEYGGQRYSTQTTQEPGSTIPLQVSVTPAVNGPAGYTMQPPAVNQAYEPAYPSNYAPMGAPVYVQPAPVTTIRFSPEVVYQGGGWWGARHRHWD